MLQTQLNQRFSIRSHLSML